jgi:hypothetical protein
MDRQVDHERGQLRSNKLAVFKRGSRDEGHEMLAHLHVASKVEALAAQLGEGRERARILARRWSLSSTNAGSI